MELDDYSVNDNFNLFSSAMYRVVMVFNFDTFHVKIWMEIDYQSRAVKCLKIDLHNRNHVQENYVPPGIPVIGNM